MSATYICAECHQFLDDEDGAAPSICWHCGSLNIAAHITVTDTLEVGTSEASAMGILIPDIGLHIPAVVTLGPKGTEGCLIESVAPAWFEIARLLSANPDALFRIGWRELEEIIAGAYANDGYQVTLTPRSADKGRDIIAEKRGYAVVKIVDSVKAYGPGRRVKAEEVRALWGVVALDRATKGVLSTTTEFAPGIFKDPSISELIPHRLELINGTTLVDRLKRVFKSK